MTNQRGQAAIFVALMFNVLFVFFAMAINVALVVHDKINLQNSVDLASYYAASKQAELLNVIAHENYAIRQSWKLLTWRYRVLGTMGLDRAVKHPVWSGETTETPFAPAALAPSVCVTYKRTWFDANASNAQNDNLCNTENLRIPPLPQVQVIAGFLGLNAGIAALSQQLRLQYDAVCSKHGAYNWWFAMSILHAFRLDQRNRKQVIFALAQNLADGSGNGDFLDLDGNSVLAGALATFKKNLTYNNLQSFNAKGGDFKMMNSLAQVDPKQWLVEIQTIPTILYTDVDGNAARGCNAVTLPVSSLPARPESITILQTPFPAGLEASQLFQFKDGNFLQGSDYQFSMGVEKNPWYMPYVGVKASTTPRQIFFPFGSGVSMVARSFAKPFGGRIGPWYKSIWQPGDNVSSGNLTDPLVAPRMEAGGLMNSPDDPRRFPNYSRFPGDMLGVSSKLALNALEGLNKLTIRYDFYKNIKEDMAPGAPNDVLAWDSVANTNPDVRNFEIAALAPDLFDITYYSIESNFSKNYFTRLVAARDKLGIPPTTPIRPDLGHNLATPEFSVQDQMKLATDKALQRPEAFYFVRDRFHLLTSWLPGEGSFNYDVASALKNFGKCTLPDDKLPVTNPGSCVAGGGRTGYSVKLVSRDALLSGQHNIGGPGTPPGAILNPPKAQDGW